MLNSTYLKALEIKQEISKLESALFDLNNASDCGKYIYIPDNEEIKTKLKEFIKKELKVLTLKFKEL